MGQENTYENFDRPYSRYMSREDRETAMNDVFDVDQGEGGRTIKDGQAFNNIRIDTWIKSRSYQPKKQGFVIDARQGYIECVKLWVGPGGVIGGSLAIPDDVTPESFHVDALGNTWWGGTTLATSTASVLNTGLGTFSNVVITGGSIAGIPVSNVGSVSNPSADIVPTGLTASGTGVSVSATGTISAYVTLTWDAIGTSTFNEYQLRYKIGAFTYYNYINTKDNTITIEGLLPNVEYNFGIASINKYGTRSAFSANINQTTASSTTPPATVAGVSATGGIQYVIVEWTANSEKDIASYNIYRHTSNNPGAAVLAGNTKGTYFIDGGRAGGAELFYWVKAINTSGLLSTDFSAVVNTTPRNVTSDDVVTIAGSKVLIDGTVYLSDWQQTGDVTKISGGQISTGTITTTQLNFTPIEGTNVIASINASAEGIKIESDNIRIGSAANYWDIITASKTALTATSASADVIINYGKTDFGDDTTAGFILGYDYSAAKSKFEIGSSATKIFKYDGTDLSLIGGTITGGSIAIGSSNNIFKADSNGIYLGNATFSSAPFRVAMDGAVNASNLNITGGAITGVTIAIGSSNNIFKADSNGIYLGNATFSSAPFRVAMDGNLTVTGGAITGALIQTSPTANTGVKMSSALGGINVYGQTLSFYSGSSLQGWLYADGAMRLYSASGRNLALSAGSGTIYMECTAIPSTNSSFNLGSSSYLWGNVFTQNVDFGSSYYISRSGAVAAFNAFTNLSIGGYTFRPVGFTFKDGSGNNKYLIVLATADPV
jgi:hypothetical protein